MTKQTRNWIVKILLSIAVICTYFIILFYIPHGIAPIALPYLLPMYYERDLPIIAPGYIGIFLIITSYLWILKPKVQAWIHFVGLISLYTSWIGLFSMYVSWDYELSTIFGMAIIYSLPFQITALISLIIHILQVVNRQRTIN